MNGLPQVLLFGGAAPLLQVDYFAGSKDSLSPTATTNFTITLVNSNVVPEDDGVSNAVLIITAQMSWNSGTWTSPGFTFTIDGTPMNNLLNTNQTNRVHEQISMIRVPTAGFNSLIVTVTSSALPGSSRTTRMSANVMFNVNDSSLNFGDGSLTEQDVAQTVTPLDVDALGAIFAVSTQQNGGDVDATITSDADDVGYTMQLPQISVNGPRYLTGYRLFPAGRNDEILLPNVIDFRTVCAVVLNGAAA